MDGTQKLATVTLDATGHASFSTSTLATGTHNMTARYNGSTDDNTSTSPVLVQTVNAAAAAQSAGNQASSPGSSVPESGSFAASLAQIQVGPNVISQTAAAADPDVTILLTTEVQPALSVPAQPAGAQTSNPSLLRRPAGGSIIVTVGRPRGIPAGPAVPHARREVVGL
jgi:hypothetical protein